MSSGTLDPNHKPQRSSELGFATIRMRDSGVVYLPYKKGALGNINLKRDSTDLSRCINTLVHVTLNRSAVLHTNLPEALRRAVSSLRKLSSGGLTATPTAALPRLVR